MVFGGSEGSQPRSLIEWDPLTLKKGSVRGEGGQEKKSERAKTRDK